MVFLEFNDDLLRCLEVSAGEDPPIGALTDLPVDEILVKEDQVFERLKALAFGIYYKRFLWFNLLALYHLKINIIYHLSKFISLKTLFTTDF